LIDKWSLPCRAVNKQIPSYLKLVTDTVNETPTVASEDLAALVDVFQAFEQATRWRLEFAAGPAPDANPSLMWSAPVNPGVGASPGHIRLLSIDDATAGGPSPISWHQAAAVGEALGKLWGELLATRTALRQREAELASGVPVTLHEKDPAPPLGDRLEAVLKAGAEAVGCQAAALYLLDAATTELKLRSSWGLPQKRLTDAARPLRGAVADLEALLGHAVVLTDGQLHDYWKVPEVSFASCVCVPVSSPTIPLGTLWAFCTQPREFSDAQTNIIEVVAGRLAADLERPVLVEEALWARDQTKQLAALERSQQDQLPVASPVIAGWEIAARAYHAGPIGGTFYDCFALEGGGLSLLAGDALAHGLEGAMTAGALRAAARAFRHHRKKPQLFVERANSILWTTSAGNAGAGLFHAMLDPGADTLVFSTGGPMRVLAVSADGHTALAIPTRPLGLDEQQRTHAIRRQFRPHELLLVYGTTFMSDSDELILGALDQRLALSLEPRLTLPAEQLIEIAGEILQTYAAREPSDRVLMLVKRRDR
jgi:sigma-B regulation protein RsbU (phosphoserine phosphatase)